ncbi:Ppx/GppA phosphatase family protein [Bifidobacterium pseudolongum]|uniref:Ppx/GppA phosphatase family protein n=1 Tax=Bifidobacterium pseudolongum TaxID=1694 RepID=UPI000507F4AB|nr:exopolyphosphatase [Bifidobacterium pseudolongum]KFI77589.1 Exopolyphosphatase [Bifidobacterium pseudolongum subsp. pseudolongum]
MANLKLRSTRLGVLDIGSNTVHMLVVDAAVGARPEPEASSKTTVRLMDHLKDDGSIKKQAVDALLAAVDDAMRLAEQYKVSQLLALATSAMHEAPNGNKILHRVEEVIGQRVTVLSGEDEARLTFLAARRWYGWDAGRLLMIDIGGGSLEVALGSDEEPTIAAAVNAGARVVTRDMLPDGMASAKDLDAAYKKVRKMIAPVVDAVPAEDYSSHAVGTSKAIRSLARLAGTVIHQPGARGRAVRGARAARGLDPAPRRDRTGPARRTARHHAGPRHDNRGAGIIAVEIMRALGINEIEVCPWALREGAILRWLDQYGRTRFGF